jgi:hypothetical protein
MSNAIAKSEKLNTILADLVEDIEKVGCGPLHLARCLLEELNDEVALLPRPDSAPDSQEALREYYGIPTGNCPYPKFDKYTRILADGKHEGKRVTASFYGDEVDDMPLGKNIAREIERAKDSAACNPKTRKERIAALNGRRTNAVKEIKKAVRIAQHIYNINEMDDVEAECCEEYGNKILVADPENSRIFELLSVSEFLRLDVEKARALGGTYLHLLASRTEPPKTTTRTDAELKAELKIAVEELQNALTKRGKQQTPTDVVQTMLEDLKKKVLDIVEA